MQALKLLFIALLFLPSAAFAYTVQPTTGTFNTEQTWGYDDGGTTILLASQSFVTVAAGSITQVTINAQTNGGSPSDHVFYEVRTDTTSGCGTISFGHCPSSTVLATSNNGDITTTDPTNQTVVITITPTALSAATRYWITMKRTGANSGTAYYLSNRGDSSACADGSSIVRQVNGTWSQQDGDGSCWNIVVNIDPPAPASTNLLTWWMALWGF